MKKSIVVIVLLIGLTAYLGFATWATQNPIKQGDFISVCKPGKDCGKFETGALNPDGCKCGTEKEPLHVLKIEGEFAVLCQCGGGCACDLNAKNPYLCGCGNPVKVVRLVK